MVASRNRWFVTASSTGRGGNAAPALLKCRTLSTPGVSERRDGTSSAWFMCASWQAMDRQVALPPMWHFNLIVPNEAMTNLFDLTGRNAIVTGSAQGMGRAMALALAE